MLPWMLAVQGIAKAAPVVARGLGSLASPAGESTAASSPASSTRSRPKLDAEQKGHARIIAEEFGRAQLPPELGAMRDALTLAAIVNAWHESRLRARAHNATNEDSIGLFQVNRQGALGAPYSREQLRDPRFNARVILTEVRNRRAELAAARTIRELTAAFATHVERPRDRFEVGRLRGSTVRTWFGERVSEAPAAGWSP